MPEFELSGVTHRTRRLSAYAQWELLQDLAPALGVMSGLAYGLRVPGLGASAAARLLAPLADLSEAQIAKVMQACCDACERLDDGAWGTVSTTPRLADLTTMMMFVVDANFGKMYAMERPKFQRTEPSYNYTAVTMPNGKDWLFRPVLRDKCRLESLYDGTLRIEHIAEANDALDVSDENEIRARKAAEKAK